MQIKINGKNYDYFNEVVISTTLDTIASTFTFFALYDTNNPDHVAIFRPLSYAKCEFFDDEGALISTGRIEHWKFKSDREPNLVQLSGRSLPGILDDCQIPYSLYPLESDNMTLAEIANKLIKPFGLTLIIYPSVAAECAQIIPKTVAKVDETIKDYICKVANQKNVVVSHDIHGNLIMFRPDITVAAKLQLTGTNTLSMELEIDGTRIHSYITCLRQPSKGNGENEFTDDEGNDIYQPGDQNQFTDAQGNSIYQAAGPGKVFKISSIDSVNNPLVQLYRPFVDRLKRGTFYDTNRAALNMRAAELKYIKVLFSLDHWEPVSVGDIVEVLNPEIFINVKARMVLESTTIQQSGERKTMTGVLVLAETFNGDEPQGIFG